MTMTVVPPFKATARSDPNLEKDEEAWIEYVERSTREAEEKMRTIQSWKLDLRQKEAVVATSHEDRVRRRRKIAK